MNRLAPRMCALALWGLGAAATAGCSTAGNDDGNGIGFPDVGDTSSGKGDALGRSLVGPPNAYPVEARAVDQAEAFEQELVTNAKARREFGWQVALKAIEPVPLLGLEDQLGARPDCPGGVSDRDLDRCGKERSAEACEARMVRDHAICEWSESAETCAPVCDNLKLEDGAEIPEIARFQSWYGVEDLNLIFKSAYGGLSDEEQFVRASLSDEAIGEAFIFNNTNKDRISNWPLRRYTKEVDRLFGCELDRLPEETDEAYEDRCALQRQSQFSGAATAGGGIARILYSPAMARHMVGNYAQVLDCAEHGLGGTWCEPGQPCEEDPDNFSTCFASEFPTDAGAPYEQLGLPAVGGSAVVKLTWSRVGFDFELPAYDTDAEALTRLVGEGANALWSADGDRSYAPPTSLDGDLPFPTPDDIVTIQTRGGSIYRLTGMHVATKETRHWVWVSLWWSDTPDEDFGADRPEAFGELAPAWSNYKMCVAVDYFEADPEVQSRFVDHPSLQAAMNATGSGPGEPTWCSNPYIEKGAGNARTNCIGCHQHAGTRWMPSGTDFDLEQVIAEASANASEENPFPANGRTQVRNTFATDYSWAFSRMDDLTELIRREVEFANVSDDRWSRLETILNQPGDAAAGEEVFRNASETMTCTDCHGDAGQGDFGPGFEALFAQKSNWELLYTIVEGRGPMPDWGEDLSDQQLTDLMTYLETNFADPDVR